MSRLVEVILVSTVAAVSFGCAQKANVPQAVIEDKIYTVTPNAVKVTAGIVNGELTELKVMERVEQGSGRVDTAAKLSGKLKLTNSSPDQTVRILGGKIVYIDNQGKPIKLEEARTEPTLKFNNAMNASDRIDPGQDEGERFPLCRQGALATAFAGAGLRQVRTSAIEMTMRFADFDDYWQPFLGGQGPAPAHAMSLDEAARKQLRDLIRARIPTHPDGTIVLAARAWAARGAVVK